VIRLSILACLVAALCLFAHGQAAIANAKPEDQVTQLERDWLAADAKGDVTALSRIIADDFIGRSPDGHVLSKEDIIPQGSGPGGFAGATPAETSVRIFGDTGILMGSIKPADAKAENIQVTLVCQKRPRGWQLIAAQLTSTPAQQ
jgi:ketosteroid isomerase-like protein